jgi:hypothetical protein
VTLTQKAFASTPTAHLSRWHGGPSRERVDYLRSASHYDSGDPWKGRKIGKTYGCLYQITRDGLVPVRYDAGGIVIESPTPGGPLYSWVSLRARGYFSGQ